MAPSVVENAVETSASPSKNFCHASCRGAQLIVSYEEPTSGLLTSDEASKPWSPKSGMLHG